jgi:cytochrome c biogenesis protein CcmG/thiol:disulfide interchange protein DsbE
MTRRRAPIAALLAAALAALVWAGCGSSGEGQDYGGSHPDYKRALAGAPAPLAKLHGEADKLLDGGTEAFEARLAALKGYPVVANVWASWCGPCRFEFPDLQKLSARYGKQVAFIGVNSQDSESGAKTFLEEAPLSYPSYNDPDKKIASSIGALGFPDTAFYNAKGELAYIKQGAYAHSSEMEADLKRYALESG